MTQGSSSDRKKEKKIFEPTLHFTTRRVQIGEDDSADKMLVAELVRKGDLLLDFGNFERFKDKGFQKQKVEAGKGTQLLKDKDQLVAEVTGYPRVNLFTPQGTNEEVVEVSVEPLFRIDHGKMKVILSVHPPLKDCKSLLTEDLEQLLEESGIVFGVNADQVTKAKQFIQQGLMEFATFPIAEGVECGGSKDAYLRYEIEIGPIAGKIMENGSIDFRDRRIMVPVNTGDLLATKIPSQSGISGKNVFGEEIEAKPGKDIKVKTLGSVKYSDETHQVRATGDGVLSVVRGSVIQVSTKQKINSDIDFATGNIESKNCVIIRGAVQPGFIVKAEGDIEIGGPISSATVEGGANVVLKSGITGKKTTISARGDADILFIEQGRITTGGNCVIRKQAYYSVIHADENIRCRRDSVVVGGELVAGGSMTLGDVGSEQSTPSLLAAGVLPERFVFQRELKNHMSELQDEIIQQMQQGGARSRKLRQMEREAEDIKQQLLRLNLIPGTGKYSRVDKGDDKRFTDEEYSDQFGVDMRIISIDAFGTVQAGTTIQIGNRTLTLDKTIQGRSFKLNSSLRRVVAVPLGRKKS